MDFSGFDWVEACKWLALADGVARAHGSLLAAVALALNMAWLLWTLRSPLGRSARFAGWLVSWPVAAPIRRIARALTPPPPAPPPPLGELAQAIVEILAAGPCEVVPSTVPGGVQGVRVAGRAMVRARCDGWLHDVQLGPDQLDVRDRLERHEDEAVAAAALLALERIEADRVAVALKQAWVAGQEAKGPCMSDLSSDRGREQDADIAAKQQEAFDEHRMPGMDVRGDFDSIRLLWHIRGQQGWTTETHVLPWRRTVSVPPSPRYPAGSYRINIDGSVATIDARDVEECRLAGKAVGFPVVVDAEKLAKAVGEASRCKGTGRVRESGGDGSGCWSSEMPCKGCQDCGKGSGQAGACCGGTGFERGGGILSNGVAHAVLRCCPGCADCAQPVPKLAEEARRATLAGQ